MNIIKSLKSLGLNEKEARVYIALLQVGESTAYRVAKHSGLKKPTVYVVLEDLIDKGLADKVSRAKKMQFVAVAPEIVFNTTKSRIETAEKEALPELKALSRGGDHKMHASYYEGLDGIKEMYTKLMRNMSGREYVGFYAHAKNTPGVLEEYWDEVNEEHRKKRIRRKAITTSGKTTEKYLDPENARKYGLKIKGLPKSKYNSNISIETYKNITQIISHKHLQGVIIDNPDVAEAVKQIFELVWNGADASQQNIKNKK